MYICVPACLHACMPHCQSVMCVRLPACLPACQSVIPAPQKKNHKCKNPYHTTPKLIINHHFKTRLCGRGAGSHPRHVLGNQGQEGKRVRVVIIIVLFVVAVSLCHFRGFGFCKYGLCVCMRVHARPSVCVPRVCASPPLFPLLSHTHTSIHTKLTIFKPPTNNRF